VIVTSWPLRTSSINAVRFCLASRMPASFMVYCATCSTNPQANFAVGDTSYLLRPNRPRDRCKRDRAALRGHRAAETVAGLCERNDVQTCGAVVRRQASRACDIDRRAGKLRDGAFRGANTQRTGDRRRSWGLGSEIGGLAQWDDLSEIHDASPRYQ
jgi:hypothetical protein